MATTWAACRDQESTLIESLTPTTQSGVKFRRYRYEKGQDFRRWAEENPAAAFRRFYVQRLFEVERQNISGVRSMVDSHEVIVAYPSDHRYGADGSYDMQDLIDEDRIVIDGNVGVEGYGNLTNHVNWTDGDWYSIEIGDAVSFLVLTYRHQYHEAATS